jgi:hypothetical protein
MPLPEPTSQQLAIGEVLALLAGASTGGQLTGGTRLMPPRRHARLRLRAGVTEPETSPGRTSESVTSPAAGAATGSVVSRGGRGHT